MSTKNAYRLINPYIEGPLLDSVVRASNSFSAGKKLYNTMSNFFTNHLNNFYMTVQNLETKDLTHFRIDEQRGGDETVDFKLVKLEKNFNPDLEKKLINSVEKLGKQTGGKHKRHHKDDDDDDESSTSDSSSDDNNYYRLPVQPISRFVYFYLPYYKLNFVGLNPLDASRIFLPMFGLPINPSLEIRFDLYRFL